MIFALALPVLIMTSGGALDYGNAVRIKSAVQAAADSASLAAVRFTGRDAAARKAASDAIFAFNLGDLGVDIGQTTLSQDGNTFIYAADFKVATPFMKILGVDSLAMETEAAATAADSPLDIVLVLDSSGSMVHGNRMGELKKSVTLFLSKFKSNEHTQVGLVPFDSQVKATGSLFGVVANTTVANPFAGVSCNMVTDPMDRQACYDNVNFKPSAVDCNALINATHTDRSRCSPTADGFRATSERIYSSYYGADIRYRAFIANNRLFVYRDQGTYFCFFGCGWINTTATTKLWEGPSGRAVPVASKPNESETANNDLIALAPGPWPRCFVDRTQPYDTTNDAMTLAIPATIYPEASCATPTLEPITGLTKDLNKVNAAAQKLTPSGNTNITIGIQWGMEAFTPASPFTGAQNGDDVRKIMVILTDGENTQNRWMGSRNRKEINQRTLLACENARKAGIEIHTINLVEGDAKLLSACASNKSFFYQVATAGELEEAFETIAYHAQGVRLIW
ncbi:VWA domain-containing protein [Fulvimarina sp. 2208YS6-2-32]|nr:VWA domain-containing protein [Fulvimarina sp. 2208YS6-2-32]